MVARLLIFIVLALSKTAFADQVGTAPNLRAEVLQLELGDNFDDLNSWRWDNGLIIENVGNSPENTGYVYLRDNSLNYIANIRVVAIFCGDIFSTPIKVIRVSHFGRSRETEQSWVGLHDVDGNQYTAYELAKLRNPYWDKILEGTPSPIEIRKESDYFAERGIKYPYTNYLLNNGSEAYITFSVHELDTDHMSVSFGQLASSREGVAGPLSEKAVCSNL